MHWSWPQLPAVPQRGGACRTAVSCNSQSMSPRSYCRGCPRTEVAPSQHCRLQEVDLVESAVAAVVRFSRDESHAARHAAARATGHLALAELKGTLEEDTALNPLVPVMVALVGTDQSSDVQRQMLLVCPRTLPMHPFLAVMVVLR